MRVALLVLIVRPGHSINWNFFSSSAPDIEHGQDFSDFFHEVISEHREEAAEIEEQHEEHAHIVEQETRNLTSLMAKLQEMFDQAETEEEELEKEEQLTEEEEQLKNLMETASDELEADIKKIEHDLSCNFEEEDKTNDEEIEPIYKTRPNKLLIPMLAWGPNNQLRGFRESIILAIQLNRTLCIPPFYKHFTDGSNAKLKGSEDPIDASYRIDKKQLRRLVSTCDNMDIATICRSRIDGIFMARDLCNNYAMSSLNVFREVTGILPFMDAKCKPRPTATIYPSKGSKHYSKNIDKLTFEPKRLKEIYPDQPKCAVWLFPYVQFRDFTMSIFSSWNNKERLDERQFIPILENVVRYTSRPETVVNIVNKFMNENLNGIKFIAVHYRFDKSDWMKHCEDKGKENNKSCQQVIDILNDIPKALNYFADYVENQLFMHDIGAVYLAAPPGEAEVKSGMEIILKERLGDKFKLLTSADLVPYIHQHNCNDRIVYDILSTAEQEICVRSNTFLRSSPSSWSRNVYVERLVHREYKHFVASDNLLLNILYKDDLDREL